MSQAEKRIENQIKQWLENNSYWYIKVQGGCNNPSAGVPDILACIKGRFVGIEVKRPKGGVITTIQKFQINEINRSGGVAFVCTSLEELRLELSQAGVLPYDALPDAD